MRMPNRATAAAVTGVWLAAATFLPAAVAAQTGAPADTAGALADSAAVVAEVAPLGAYEPVWEFATDLFGISSGEELQTKATKIAVVLLIAMVAKFFMDGVQLVSRFFVYSQWGPLKFLFRNRQRSVTVHALSISLLKYVVYFTALGYIVKQFGINPTTYLASLSLVGIAIGFGSQGLVQDIVTGFFILFENQFSVGDMVEISGQVGIVEEIGLRTTRLRNYNGALVIFQNRNIPMAGLYRTGAMDAGVDVAIADRAAAEKAGELLEQAGRELQRQFEDVIMSPPEVEGLLELATGELFVRLRAPIWPLQQWVIDAQLVPRVRELFKRHEVEIPADRVVTFYHFPAKSDAAGSLGLARLARLAYGRPPGGGKD